MSYERFEEKFCDLTLDDRLEIFNDYCNEDSNEDKIYNFDEEFFDIMFADKMGVCRATVFGNVDFNHCYICFDVYGNLQSLSNTDVIRVINDRLEDIYNHEDLWSDKIEDYEEDSEEE